MSVYRVKKFGFAILATSLGVVSGLAPRCAWAALNIPLTVTMSEAVTVDTAGGTPRIPVDVGGTTRYASYSSGSGTNTLTFTLSPTAGDVDLDGIAVSSPVDLNGGAIRDVSGNAATLTFTPPNTAGIKVDYPSLGMDFVYDADGRYTLNGVVYNDLPSLLTAAGGSFTRSGTSQASYFDGSGVMKFAVTNTPRFDYDPVAHTAKGILIEESRTNYLQRSGEFDNAVWTKSGTTVNYDVVAAPSGNVVGDKLIETAANAQHYWAQTYSYTSGSNYTHSVFAKAGEKSVFSLYLSTAAFGATGTGEGHYDLSAGTATITGTGAQGGIQAVGNGWYRCWISKAATATSSTYLYMTFDNLNTYSGDGTSGLYVWGAQIEQGTFPTSYIPTTTAAVTRGADVFTIPVGVWYSGTESTLYGEFDRSGQGTGGYGLAGLAAQMRVDDANSVELEAVNANPVGAVIKFSNTFTAYLLPNKPSGTSKAAATFNAAGGRVSVDGATQTFGTSAAIPSFTQLTIGRSNRGGGQNWFNSTIKGIRYYPLRVSDTQLQLLSQ